MRQSLPSSNGQNVIDHIAEERTVTHLVVTTNSGKQMPFEKWFKLWTMNIVDGIPVKIPD